jgi:hypothetical protein
VSVVAGAARLLGAALVVSCAGTGLGPLPARAADAPADAPAASPGAVTLNGLVSASYDYNFNVPPSRTNALRVFDFADDTFQLDLLELVLQRQASKPRASGFRVDLALGSSVPRTSSSAGLFRQDSLAEDIDMHQVFLTYVAPLGSGLRIDAGKFVTHHGYEVIDGYDGWNDDATRSFLFGYAIPYTHVGVRASYAFSPRISAMGMVVNGWDVARDNNRSKSVGGQLALAPTPALSVTVNGTFGPERAGVETDPRSLLDVVATWKPITRLAVALDGAWGDERNAAMAGHTAHWDALEGTVRLACAGPFAIAARGETFEDPDGARTGTPQRLSEWTLTPEVRVSPQILIRADLRLDRSDVAVFPKRRAMDRTQPTALLNVLCNF